MNGACDIGDQPQRAKEMIRKFVEGEGSHSLPVAIQLLCRWFVDWVVLIGLYAVPEYVNQIDPQKK